MRFTRSWIAAATVASLTTIAIAADSKDTTKSLYSVRQLKPQTLCPVMGKPIDSSAYTDIQGQRVYHCCSMCSEQLLADPDKYFRKAAEDGVLFENIQTTCPVSGQKLAEKARFIDYEGRRLFFCSDSCLAMFRQDPAGYLKRLNN